MPVDVIIAPPNNPTNATKTHSDEKNTPHKRKIKKTIRAVTDRADITAPAVMIARIGASEKLTIPVTE